MNEKQRRETNTRQLAKIVAAAHRDHFVIAPVNEDYYLARVLTQAGKWYFCGDCSACKNPVPLFADLLGGNVNARLSGPGRLFSFCRNCRQERAFPANDVYSVQWV